MDIRKDRFLDEKFVVLFLNMCQCGLKYWFFILELHYF